jgi:hypothetical protein
MGILIETKKQGRKKLSRLRRLGRLPFMKAGLKVIHSEKAGLSMCYGQFMKVQFY